MRAGNIPGESSPLLEPPDIVEPLTHNQIKDADAILFMAGSEGTLSEVTSFAYYHRKKLTELIENPAVDSALMLDELFDSLPSKIEEDNLLDRLTTEVEELRITPYEPAPKPVRAAPTRSALSRPSPMPVPKGQLVLFDSQVMAIQEPSETLVRTAERLETYDENIHKYFGHIAKLMRRVDPQNKPLKIAFMVPAIAEVILEAVVLYIPIDNTYGRLLRSKFKTAISVEYPHIRSELKGLKGSSNIWNLRVRLEEYAGAVLSENTANEEQTIEADDPPPPNQLSMDTSSGKASRPRTGSQQLTPIVQRAI